MKNFRAEKHLQEVRIWEKEVKVSMNARFKGITSKAQEIWVQCKLTLLKYEGPREAVKLPLFHWGNRLSTVLSPHHLYSLTVRDLGCETRHSYYPELGFCSGLKRNGIFKEDAEIRADKFVTSFKDGVSFSFYSEVSEAGAWTWGI